MLNFLHDVRLFKVSPGGLISLKSEDASDSEGSTTEISSPDGKVIIHKHPGSDTAIAIPIVAIVFTFIWLIVKAIMAPFHQRNRQVAASTGGGLSDEEVAILHKLQRTLSQMESRVEALETILIDQSRTEKHYGSKL